MTELSGLRIMHPRFDRAFSEALTAIQMCGNRGAIVPILGPTRTGKSELVDALDEQLGTGRSGPGTMLRYRDFVIGNVEPQPNPYELFASIGRALNDAVPPNWKLPRLKAWVIEMVRDRDTRYVVLDECSHCAEPGANLSSRAAADHWKRFVDATGVTLILVGLPKFQSKIIDKNEQFRARSMQTIYLMPYNWMLDQDREDFVDTVTTIYRHLEKNGADLQFDQQDMTRRLYAVTGGRVGLVVELVDDALKTKGTDGKLTVNDIRHASRISIQRSPHTRDAFEGKTIPDSVLRNSYARVLEEAKLEFVNDRATVDAHTLAQMRTAAE